MALRYIPLTLRHAGTPKIAHFALLSGLEAAVRGTLISAMPLTVYSATGSAELTSSIYFAAGITGLIWGLCVPGLNRLIPRRWMYTLGCLFYLCGMALAATGTIWGVSAALLVNACATVTIFVCLNAYVLDYVSREDLGKSQSIQMLFAAAPWAIGPMLGVWLRDHGHALPFALAGFFALALLTTFLILRLGNGKQIARAKGPAPNPLAYLGRFFSQGRLVAGWLFAVIRSCGWWVYVVYLPIFCVESGLGDKVGGIALSLSNALLFITPWIAARARILTVRTSVRAAFGACALLFAASAALSPFPWLAVLAMAAASFFLVVLDVVGGLPFLMAVKPSERTDMAAVYSSFRDVSGILTPGIAWAVLLVAPVPAIFAVCAAGLATAWAIAANLHPRLGTDRPSHGLPVRSGSHIPSASIQSPATRHGTPAG
jgi:MFS family permease